MSEETKIQELTKKVEELERELSDKRAMVELLFDHNPDGVVIVDAKGNLRSNPVASELTHESNPELEREEWTSTVRVYRPDKVTPIPEHELGMIRTITTGEIITDELVYLVSDGRPEGRFVASSSRPLPGGGALVVTRDVTEKRLLEEQLGRRTEELAAREQDNRELIARLRAAVDELSTPVLEVWEDVLALPVVGIVDTQRSAQMTERLLQEIVRSRSRHVIVDLTGVEMIDTSTADRFIKLARSVQLLGARCIVTGIQPAVAQTLVELGVEFGSLETHRNLKNALQACVASGLGKVRSEGGGRR